MKLISIVIPVFNVSKYIAKCLESVSKQTFTHGIECILIDDCGSDDSMNIAREFIKSYRGPIDFKIISHECNKGLSAARNTGIKNAVGEYIYFLDSDDFITDDCLESFFDLVKKYNHPEFIIGGAKATKGFSFFNLENRPSLPEYVDDYREIKWLMLHRSILPMTAWNKLISKKFLISNNLFFKESIIHEDELWNASIVFVLRKLIINKKNTYHYIVRQNSIITQQNTEKSLNSWFVIWDHMTTLLTNPLKNYQIRIIGYIIVQFLRKDCISAEMKKTCREKLSSLYKQASFATKMWLYFYEKIPQAVYSNILLKKFFQKFESFSFSRFANNFF